MLYNFLLASPIQLSNFPFFPKQESNGFVYFVVYF